MPDYAKGAATPVPGKCAPSQEPSIMGTLTSTAAWASCTESQASRSTNQTLK